MPKIDATKKLAKKIRDILLDKKGEDVLLLDIRKQSSIADYFVISSGTSTRHVEAMGDEIFISLKQEEGIHPRSIEGKGEGTWVLLDYNDIIVHLFYHETRRFYQLEKLWHKAIKVK